MLLQGLYIMIYAILFSLLEIEMEGKYGWAENMPTPKFFYSFTLYHTIMNIIVILTLTYSLHFNSKPLEIIFYIMAWFLIEDTMWFMLNPHYTIKGYKRENIWWQGKQEWYFGMPAQNYIGLAVMVVLAFLNKDIRLLYNSIAMSTLIGLVLYLAPHYHKFHKKTHNKKALTNKFSKPI